MWLIGTRHNLAEAVEQGKVRLLGNIAPRCTNRKILGIHSNKTSISVGTWERAAVAERKPFTTLIPVSGIARTCTLYGVPVCADVIVTVSALNAFIAFIEPVSRLSAPSASRTTKTTVMLRTRCFQPGFERADQQHLVFHSLVQQFSFTTD